VAVSDKDHGYRALVDRIFTMGKPKIEVGILDGGKTEDGMTIVEIATINEFGLGVPQRSFLRAWFDENEPRAQEAMRRLLVSVVEGKRTKEQALEVFGLWVQGEIQKRISEGIAPANAPSTIAKKGSSTPLVDNGILKSAVSFRVVP
jgi:hypothetical protein